MNSSYTPRRAVVCPYCERTQFVNGDGTVRRHRSGGTVGVCHGSGRPAEAMVAHQQGDILWKQYGRMLIGTTDCGVRFSVSRRRGERFYSLSFRTAGGGEREWSDGYQSVRAAKASAAVTLAGLRKAVR